VVLLDAGPLVAYLNAGDHHHRWAKEQLSLVQPPLLSCEAVFSETLFLLRDGRETWKGVLGLVENGFVRLPFRLQEEAGAISRLMQRYADVPMSLADACLVRMTEQHDSAVVLTLDSDFAIYRRHRRQVIPTIRPA
jgi:predicted nucleic acid-binding protein